ncbi:chromosomal replication initiator protein [Trichlorobacter thiogenes]|uniref:Chromosomal replication initiator protein n=1 Tax=Trichlorobacter thiogenes TaxID=115783 RepID=A0A1T4S0W0_9BACT|nr:DnaA/Hda family protein [Trichlorobacter thiogenes]SKA21797.1 chromosomal replication initiator protein [Trichlorobacter thiogenes]
MLQQALDLPVTPRYGFENFISCAGNSSALEFSRRITNPAEPEKLLYLYGPAGSGKTHLLHAIGRQLAGEQYQVLSCRNLTVPISTTSNLLLVDDLDQLPDQPELRNALWEAFNQQYSSGHTLALAGRFAPKELPTIDEHLISRLLWGLVARLDVSDDRSRQMLIAKLAQDRQIILPDDVASWLLTVLPRDVGSLVSACDALYRAALQRKCRITLRLARELVLLGTLTP